MGTSAAKRMNEALIKSMYRAALNYIAEKINLSINAGSLSETSGTSKSTGRAVLKKSVPGVGAAVGVSIVPLGGTSIGVLGECFLFMPMFHCSRGLQPSQVLLGHLPQTPPCHLLCEVPNCHLLCFHCCMLSFM